jgi:hypothetical protein
MITNYLSKNSKKLFLIGLYRPEDFYFAHLLEHCLAVDLGKRNIIRVLHANIGGGYIFISGDVADISKTNHIPEYISSFNIDPNSLNHQKKILISEKLYKDRVNFNRDVYESLETNSGSQGEETKLFNEFVLCESVRLGEKIQTVFNNTNWIIIGEDFNQIKLQKILSDFPVIRENKLKFVSPKTSSDFVFAEIGIEIPLMNKTIEFVSYLLNKHIFEKIQDMHILYGTHTIANNFAETWNKRSIIHYSGYFPKEYADEFFDSVIEEWQDATMSTEDKKLIKKLINGYIKDRTIEESIMELLEYGSLIEKGWEHEFDLTADLSVVQSNLKIYKRTIGASL